ncbi:MAG: membrane protein [Saprospiraceae bacterium]|nr:MAG: membrane protein [Saprospiraceae bacterium]
MYPIKISLRIALYLGLIPLLFTRCAPPEEGADAYGNFEVTHTTVGVEVPGKLMSFQVQEGQTIESGAIVGWVDTTQLYLQRLQLEASIRALGKKRQNPKPEIAVLEEQKNTLLREKTRFENLLADRAATPKQVDDIKAQIELVDAKIDAAKRQSQTVNTGIMSESDPLAAQIALVEDKISKSFIRNPTGGTVLTKLSEPGEVVGIGTPLYRIASLDTLTLRAYFSGSQLGQVKLGEKVHILVDEGPEQSRTYEGLVTWISDQSEFTPKTIQTKEERVNLVYATKIKVKNDGYLKVGMPAEVYLSDPNLAAQ